MTERFADSKLPDPSQASGGGPPGAGYAIAVDGEAEFKALVERSAQVPVVVDLWASWCEPCKRLSPILDKVAASLGGRLLLAKIDVDKNQRIAAAFGAQSVPTVVALIRGQAVPLFQGALGEAEVRQFFDELLKAAAAAGVSGLAGAAQPAAPPLPPAHQEGYDAIERGDLAAAKLAFGKALAEAPGDPLAKAALAQVELMERIDQAGQPEGPLAQALAAADREVAAGASAQAFNRLLAAMAGAAPEAKETLRLRLLSLFEVAGPDDPAVAQARRRLAGLLF
ncbi:MAG: tetratricopeptide repeat protein [Bifidobacteriaceae bacterium]|jgi:putative thioredoxin|nr:tetratricopeptide repeat protein [Bifidobacteriaceae bacterium]